MNFIAKLYIICLLACSAHAANIYVASASSTPAGNDSNAGTIGAPVLTLSHAFALAVCGDTIIIVADGNFVAGDSNVPYFTACALTSRVQSSKLAMFQPSGYRTNPAVDSANYGKLSMTAQGIWAQVEGHGSFGSGCLIGALASDIFTLGFCNGGWQNVANGTQIYLEVGNEGYVGLTSIPTGLTILQKYYIVNCTACGAAAGTFQLSATSGGAAITGLSCTPPACVADGGGGLRIYEPLQVDTTANTLTSPDALTVMGNNTPIYVSSSGLQLNTLTSPASSLPAPLQLDTQYYMISTSGRQFQLSLTQGGSAIDLTTVGVGPLSISDARAPHDWVFDGLELRQGSGHLIFGGMYIFGASNEASALGMVNHIEVARSWVHEDSSQEGSPNGPARGIYDNATNNNYHDNYIAGITFGEANGIAGCGSPGPTLITNNFIEADGENVLYGGCTSASGVPNANKTLTGNYFYKPPAWRTNAASGVPSGACWYDNYDPNHTGGQWYTNTSGGQVYQCTSGHVWATTGATPPSTYTVKTMTEWKDGRAFTFSGNSYAYNWPEAQSGQVFNIGQQEGSGPGMSNDTIVIKNNKMLHTEMFLNWGESCFKSVSLPCVTLPHDFTITNNLSVMEQIACGVPSVGGTGDCGHAMDTTQMSGYPPVDLVYDHNTVFIDTDGIAAAFPWDAAASFFEITPGTGTLNNWRLTNSIMGYDFNGDGSACGGHINTQFTNSTFDRLANANAGCGSYTSVGATNTFTNWSPQTNNAGIGFVNLSGGDYHLATTSPYSASCASGCAFVGSDGKDIGADIDLITWKTSGAEIGTPPWDTRENLTITPLSAGATIVYDRPGTTACNLTIYNSPARISANENADTNTSGKKLDSRTGNTVSSGHVTFNVGFNSALSAATQYWYALSCVAADTSTWLVAGDSFTTLSTAAPAPRRQGSSRRFSGSRN